MEKEGVKAMKHSVLSENIYYIECYCILELAHAKVRSLSVCLALLFSQR